MNDPVLDVDYTQFDPGFALAENIILVPCPKCGLSAHRRGNLAKGDKYVHEVRIEMRKYLKSKIMKKIVIVKRFCLEKVGERRQRQLEEAEIADDFPF